MGSYAWPLPGKVEVAEGEERRGGGARDKIVVGMLAVLVGFRTSRLKSVEDERKRPSLS